jgi:hypothetical protein
MFPLLAPIKAETRKDKQRNRRDQERCARTTQPGVERSTQKPSHGRQDAADQCGTDPTAKATGCGDLPTPRAGMGSFSIHTMNLRRGK